MTDHSPDPVADAAAYQALLLGALGDDDPAAVQAATPSEIGELIEATGPFLRTRPGPGEWCVLECIGHIVDAEVVSAGRYRWIVAHDGPDLVGYDQDRWVSRLRHVDDDPAELSALFQGLRTANLALWARATDEERARVGMHRERGPESLDLSFRLIAGHDRVHVAQARKVLAAVGGAPAGRV